MNKAMVTAFGLLVMVKSLYPEINDPLEHYFQTQSPFSVFIENGTAKNAVFSIIQSKTGEVLFSFISDLIGIDETVFGQMKADTVILEIKIGEKTYTSPIKFGDTNLPKKTFPGFLKIAIDAKKILVRVSYDYKQFSAEIDNSVKDTDTVFFDGISVRGAVFKNWIFKNIDKPRHSSRDLKWEIPIKLRV